MEKTAKKILIIDDDLDIVFVIKTALENQGYDVSIAYNGIEAITKATSESPDLILLDIMMPGVDGHTLNALFKKNTKTSGIPIVVITGRCNSHEFAEIQQRTIVEGYLKKPFMLDQLLEMVKYILETGKGRNWLKMVS